MIKKILIGVLAVVLLLAAAASYLWFFQQTHHSTPVAAPAPIKPTGNPIRDAIRRGAEFIKVNQEPDGHFSRGLLDPKPGFTALVVDALARSPDKYREAEFPFLARAAQAILAHQQPNGSLCTPAFNLDTYTTSVSILALTALENPAYAPAVEKARNFLISIQYRDDEANLNFGAAGYKTEGRTSGDVTAQWVEAMRAAGVKEDDPAFKNAQVFFSRLQNNPENTSPAPGTEIGEDGGFFYRPGESKAKDEIGKGGKRIPKSYGLMSYAGLKSFLYMNVKKDDPRVMRAFKWVRDNFTLEENRNIGPDGLYYYFMTMAKALSLYGEPIIETPDGVKHEWAKELSDKLLSLQDPDGSWRNKLSDRWKEDDAVMVTGYAIRTLTICFEQMNVVAPPEPPPAK